MTKKEKKMVKYIIKQHLDYCPEVCRQFYNIMRTTYKAAQATDELFLEDAYQFFINHKKTKSLEAFLLLLQDIFKGDTNNEQYC